MILFVYENLKFILIILGDCNMDDFRTQIEQDIKDYQTKYSHIKGIEKDEWAFNYWILDKFFYEDEELISEKILDYKDMGIDAYEFYEDTKDLYLIQNKYYSDSSKISTDYIENDFLLRPIHALENGTYKKSPELQEIFKKYQNNSEFTVYLQIYVTNNKHSETAEKYIREFNLKNPKYRAEIYYLDDIENKYYNDIKENKKDLTVAIDSVNKGTILKVNTKDYKLKNVVDARYVFTPVSSIFKIYRDALEKNYPIFDKNIREYLGNKGVNKKIYETLLNEEERKNFFYYNNGITLICDSMTTPQSQSKGNNINISFNVVNPQIVNGCQTVNSIYEALKNVDPSTLEKDFEDTFVMLKVLQIDRKKDVENKLYENVVKFNNSQNSIDEKTFVSNTSVFNRIKDELEKKGFLLLIKQSDKNSFRNIYPKADQLRKRANERLSKFGLLDSFEKTQDYFIPLEKLLQVIISFSKGGYQAYTKKSSLLKPDTIYYEKAIEFIKNPAVTNDTLLDLYLLYKKADIRKAKSTENRFPIPYYLIDSFAKFECDERKPELISAKLSTNNDIENIIKLYTRVTKAYTKEIKRKRSVEYNQMIKQPVEYDILETNRVVYEE